MQHAKFEAYYSVFDRALELISEPKQLLIFHLQDLDASRVHTAKQLTFLESSDKVRPDKVNCIQNEGF